MTSGPSSDFDDFIPILKQASHLVKLDQVLADAGYDSEKNHEFARKELGIRSVVIPAKPRRKRSRKIPKGKYRRQMKQHFKSRIYRSRSHVECVFSRIKRNLDPNVRARRWETQKAECLIKVLTYNLMLIDGAQNG